MLKNHFTFDITYTSVLKRAKETANLCLNSMKLNIPIVFDWRLNERHYGALQGYNKTETAKKFGEKQVHIWRRSYNVRPPSLESDDKRHPRFDKKYFDLEQSNLPTCESLNDTFHRVIPLWKETISEKIILNKKILIVGHGNSLRALLKYLNNISDDDIINLNIPTGVPLIIELDKKLTFFQSYYLNEGKSINKKIKLIKEQGRVK